MTMRAPEIVVSLWKGQMEVPPERRAMREILEEISQSYDVSFDALRGPGAFRKLSIPRQHAMWLMAQQNHLSLPMIGAFLGGRDHTTILHGIRAHGRRIADAMEQEAA